MTQFCFALKEGRVQYLGRFEDEASLKAKRDQLGPWVRVFNEDELDRLQGSIFDAYAEGAKQFAQPHQYELWRQFSKTLILRILRWTRAGDVLNIIGGRLEDDPEGDGTPFAHPAYYRGEEAATAGIVARLKAILDGTDDGSGCFGHPGLEEVRRQLLQHRTMLNEIYGEVTRLHKQVTGRDYVRPEPGTTTASKQA